MSETGARRLWEERDFLLFWLARAVSLSGTLVSAVGGLLRKIHAALVPGGWLVLRGTFLDDERTGTLEAVLDDVHMLLSTDAGGLQSLTEVTGWLAAAGFEAAQRIDVAGEPLPSGLRKNRRDQPATSIHNNRKGFLTYGFLDR